MKGQDAGSRAMWVALIVLSSVVAGACACGLLWALGAGPVAAIGAGGATFLGAATVGFAIVALLL
jgi:hypothetical protein